MDATGSIEVRDLRAEEVGEAVGVLARGMRDNPLHVAAYGNDPERRLRCHARLMGGLFRAFSAQEPICASREDVLLGVTGVAHGRRAVGCQIRTLPLRSLMAVVRRSKTRMLG